MSTHIPTLVEQRRAYIELCRKIETTPVCPLNDAHRGRITGCAWHDLDTQAGRLERDMMRMEEASHTITLSAATYREFQDWIRRHGRDGDTPDEALAYLLDEEYSRDAEQQDQARLQA